MDKNFYISVGGPLQMIPKLNAPVNRRCFVGWGEDEGLRALLSVLKKENLGGHYR